MNKLIKYKLALLFSVLQCFCFVVHADSVSVCQKLTVAGDAQWPPYVISNLNDQVDLLQSAEVTGLGVEVVNAALADLDLNVDIVTYAAQLDMLAGLRSGTIDVLMSAYKYDELTEVAQMLEVPITNDPITVAVNHANASVIKHWDDLSGFAGVMDTSFTVDDETNNYFENFLHIEHTGTLQTALQAVASGKYDYIVGSKLQLEYALRTNNLQQELVILDELQKGGEVYIAFANSSQCVPYATYMNKRLQTMQSKGELDRIVQKYTQP